MRHFGVMVLTPEQHSSIAMAYEKAAADKMVPGATEGGICPQGRLVSHAGSDRGQAKIVGDHSADQGCGKRRGIQAASKW